MPNYCAVFNCGRYASNGLTLYRFPIKDENRLPKWIECVNRGRNWLPNKSSRICSLHFETVLPGQNNCILSDPTIKNLKIEPQSKVLSFARIKIPLTNPGVQENGNGILVGKRKSKEEEESGQKPKKIHRSNQTENLPNYENILKAKDKTINKLKAKIKRSYSTVLTLRRKLHSTRQYFIALRQKKETSTTVKKVTGSLILDRLKEKNRYSQSTRQFGMTLHFYSSKAYGFVRDTFLKQLPHPQQITRWTRHVNVEPGFLTNCLYLLKSKSEEYKGKLYCSIQLDEMSIRQQLISNGSGFDGFVNYGDLFSPANKEEMAKNALFVMAVGVNSNWKIPIAYFLTSGVPAEFLSKVISRSIELLELINMECISVTYDGLSSNLKATKILGAQLGEHDMAPWFTNMSNKKTFIIPDVCHMLKLLRNMWKKVGVIYIDKHKIKWQYIEKLEELQTKEGLRAANKLTTRHVNFERQKMKVFLAAQIFSSSIANSLRLCKTLKIPGFDDEDCEYTADFIECIDRLFDCLNSKNPLARNYAAPMSKSTEPIWKSVFRTASYAFSNLELGNGERILDTKKKTPLLGFIMAMKSAEGIYNEYVTGNLSLKYILTYKFSQDHTETFFSTIRSCQGYNNNPNVIQLKYSLRKILSTRICTGRNSNCIPQDGTELTLTRLTQPSFASSSETFVPVVETQYGECLNVILRNLSLFSDCVVTYISGWVVKKVQMLIKFITCSAALQSIVQQRDLSKPKYQLLRIKQNGGLIVPSEDVVSVCNITERIYREYIVCHNFKSDVIISRAVAYVLEDKRIFCSLNSHIFDLSPLDNHIYQLVKIIVKTYCKVRMHYNAKAYTLDKKRSNDRNWNNKLTLFGGV